MQGKDKPFISVVVPARNEGKYIENCIKNILQQNYPKDRYELIVVDGASSDATKKIVVSYKEKHNNIIVLDNPRKIVSSSLNIAIKRSKAKYIVRMDVHTRYALDYLSACVKLLESTGAENVGGPMRTYGVGCVGRAIGYAHHSIFGLGGGKFHDKKAKGYVDTVYLGAFRREVFYKVGLFNEQLVRNQDIEMNARIIKKGGKIYLTPEICSKYFCRNTLGGLFTQNFKNGYWNIITILKNPGALSLRHFVPFIFIVSLLILGGFSPFFNIAKTLFLLDVASYVVADLAFSIQISIHKGLKYLLILPVIFATLHFSYGLGSLVSIISFLSGVRSKGK